MNGWLKAMAKWTVRVRAQPVVMRQPVISVSFSTRTKVHTSLPG